MTTLVLMAERGKYIVLEGGDNVGKTTQARILADDINGSTVREPGGTQVGEQIRSLILHSDEEMSPYTRALLHAAASAQLVPEIFEPLLINGVHIVSDRSWVSSAAYEGVQGVELADIQVINEFALGNYINLDLLLLLDATPKDVKSRSSGPPDRYEREHEDFHNQVREKYLEIGKKLGAVIIDATAGVEEVGEEIRSVVSEKLGI
jgi:dTMP kinase